MQRRGGGGMTYKLGLDVFGLWEDGLDKKGWG